MAEFSPIARAMIVSKVASVERKQVNNTDVAEFKLTGIALKISAWKDLAAAVPTPGSLVIVEGSIRTRTYDYEGKTRESTGIVASSITVLSTVAAPPANDEDELPF